MYYAVQAARSLAAGTVTTGTVGVGFLVMGAIAGLALWWGGGRAPTSRRWRNDTQQIKRLFLLS